MHDKDLRRWALKEARRLNDFNFKCCDTFVWKLKKDLGIRSRKVVAVVTEKRVTDDANLRETAMTFVEGINSRLASYDTDECGSIRFCIRVHLNKNFEPRGGEDHKNSGA